MTTARRPLSTLGRSRLLMTTVFFALVASLTVGLPGSAGATGHLKIGFTSATHPVTEGDDGTVTIDLTVRAYEETNPETAVPPEQDIDFTWETTDGGTNPATSGPDEDYVPASGTGTIDGIDTAGADATGETTITVEVNGDTEIEPDETFLVELKEVTTKNLAQTDSNATVDTSNNTVTVTIQKDDPKISIADTDVSEGETAQLTVSLTEPVPADGDAVTVQWSTADGDGAEAPDDYTAVSDETATIDPGEQTTVVSVQTVGDSEPESDETFTVTLTDPVNAFAGGQMSATVTILDDEPRVSIDDVAVSEGHTGTTDAVFTVTIDPPPAEEVSVSYETVEVSGDNAAAADDDYQSASGAVTFDPGEATRPIVVKVNGDVEEEGDEHFEVELTGVDPASAAHLPDGTSGTGTIVADDGARVVTVADGSTPEGDDGHNGPLTFTVTLDEAYGNDIVLDYTTSDGPEDGSDTPAATDGLNSEGDPDEDEDTDYQAAGMRPPTEEEIDGGCNVDNEQPANSVTIPAGNTEATFTVDLVGDGTHEPDEAFTVELAEPCEGGNPPLSFASDPVATGMIANDDDRPIVSAQDTSTQEEDGNFHFAEFDVRLSHPSSSCVQVAFTTVDGTATVADGDYEATDGDLFFPPGTLTPDEGARTQGCDADSDPPIVKVFGDQHVEASETFKFELFNATGADFPDDAQQFVATGTIVNDDGPEVSIGDVEVTEGDSGTVDAVLRLTTPAAEHDGFSVDYATVDGSATANADYTATSGTVTFAPNAESATVAVPVRGDTEDEPNETFTVELSDPDHAAIGDGTGQVTIVDDDDDGGPGNGQPAVAAGADRSGEVGDLLTFAASATDPDGDTLTYRWDFGDGATATGREVDHQWASPGDYAVTVTAEDGNGGQATDGVIIKIAADSGVVGRSAGAERVATALAVAADHWSATAPASSDDVNAPEGPHAVLATAATFPDALAGGALAALLDAPLLLTFPADLDPRVLDELARRDVRRVWVLGGQAAISPEIEAELTEAGYEVIRYAGSNRFETAAQVARGVGPSLNGEVVVALGSHADPNRAWPDALAAGTLTAAPDPPPVLLTSGEHLPAATTGALTDLDASKVFLMGGTAAVSPQVEQQLVDLGLAVERVAGTDRYGTSVAAAETALARHPAGDLPVVFATGDNFPDGLAAGALAAHLEGLLLLVPHRELPDGVATFLSDQAFRLDEGTVVGGDVAISERARGAAERAMIAR